MARKKDKDRTDRTEPARRFPSRQTLLTIASAVMSIGTTVAVAATVVVGHGPLLGHATELRKSELKVAFDWPPLAGKVTSRTAGGEPATWMNAEQRRELESIAIKLLSGDPFDRHALERTQRALAGTGWFSDGPWLRRFEDGVVVVTGRWRVPAAAVRTLEGDRLVSDTGESLPPVYPPGRSGMMLIDGVRTPAPALGERWPGGEVQAGLKLAVFLRPMPGADQIAAIDVSEFVTAKRLSIQTTTGGRILWGAPPEAFVPGQAAGVTKRQRLAAVYQQFGQIDAGRPTLDVRAEDGVYTTDPTALAADTPESSAKAARGSTAKNRR